MQGAGQRGENPRLPRIRRSCDPARVIAPRRSPAAFRAAAALAGVLLSAGPACVPPPPDAPAPATAAAPATATATATAPPRPLKEGVILAGAADVHLHPVEGALFLSALHETGAGPERRFYLARGDALIPQPAYTVPPPRSEEYVLLAGRAPDRVFALIHGSEDGKPRPRVYRGDGEGWTEIPVDGLPSLIAWWSDQLVGLMWEPGNGFNKWVARLDAPGPRLALPKAEGPACDAFFREPYTQSFQRLAVQPRDLMSAGGTLFVLGMGCDRQLAVASWSTPSTPFALSTIAAPMLMDGVAGKVFGRGPKDLWLLRRPMRPVSQASLWHHDGAAWTEVSLPSEDPQLEDGDVDEGGTLWVVIDGKLYRRKAEQWVERPLPPLPQDCVASAVSARDPGSLWVTCREAAVRLAP